MPGVSLPLGLNIDRRINNMHVILHLIDKMIYFNSAQFYKTYRLHYIHLYNGQLNTTAKEYK